VSSYEKSKGCFADIVDINQYINVPGAKVAYDRVKGSLDENFKIILLHGNPGTGKSMLLSRLYAEQKESREIYYFSTPPSNMAEFHERIFKILTGQEIPNSLDVTFQTFVDFLNHVKGAREIIVLIDEINMYSDEVLDEIRLLSDSGVMKFVISSHANIDDGLLNLEHFRSRIWEVVEVENLAKNEMMDYVHKRLLHGGFSAVATSIKKKSVSTLYKFTKGNPRECNKLMHAVLEICEYYEKREPVKIDRENLPKKIIEMAAIKLGYINA